MKRFTLDKAPFVRMVDDNKISTTRMMYDVLIALTPIIIFGWVINGLLPFIHGVQGFNAWHMLQPLVNVIFAGLMSCILEGLYFVLFLKVRGFKNILTSINISYAVIPGVILALILPARTPLYVILFGCFMANIIFKMLFGGFGHNVFNPALIGYVFCVAAFGSVINAAFTEQIKFVGQILPLNLDIISSGTTSATLDTIISAGTPLQHLGAGGMGKVNYAFTAGMYGGLLNQFLGFRFGGLGEVSGLLIILAYIYLSVRKVINWRTPLVYVGTVFLISWIIGIVNGVEGQLLGIWFPTFSILSGGLLFGAVFMATEPVTTPKAPNGKIIFALGCGVLTCLFRFVGSLPEGVATAILFMCLFTPIIDSFAAKLRGPVITSKIILSYALIFVLFALIAVFTVFKTIPAKATEDLAHIAVDFINNLGGIR